MGVASNQTDLFLTSESKRGEQNLGKINKGKCQNFKVDSIENHELTNIVMDTQVLVPFAR